MSDVDFLRYLIYMFAEFMFNDAVITGNRVDVYNDDNAVCLSIYVDKPYPDSITIIKGNVKQSVEATNIMNTFIDSLRMIYVLHYNPANVIKRMVSVSD